MNSKFTLLKVADRANVIIKVVLLKPMLYTLCARLSFKPSETQVVCSGFSGYLHKVLV